MTRDLFEFASLGRRYETRLGHYEAFLREVEALIESEQVPSLIGDGPDRRGFRFRFVGQSFLLRHSFDPSGARGSGQSTITLHALDPMDEGRYTIRRNLAMGRDGDVVVPYRDPAMQDASFELSLPQDPAAILMALLSA